MEMICYCFDYTDEDIINDVKKNGHSKILEKILEEKKSGGCTCVEKNPKGR
jgi:hypothetical protein